jgi:hypothetical protein
MYIDVIHADLYHTERSLYALNASRKKHVSIASLMPLLVRQNSSYMIQSFISSTFHYFYILYFIVNMQTINGFTHNHIFFKSLKSLFVAMQYLKKLLKYRHFNKNGADY